MSKTFNEFVTLVRNWANRDSEVLTNAIVTDCMNYAESQAYRVLRIADLEKTVEYAASDLDTYEVTYGGVTYFQMTVPTDMLEYIQIRRVDSTGGTVRVYNELVDVRTFHDLDAEKYNKHFWTRIGNLILVKDKIDSNSTDTLEIQYYGKEPRLNARYAVTAANANTDSSRINSGTPPTDFSTGATVPTGSLKVATYTEDADPTNVTVIYYETTVDDSNIPAAGAGYTRSLVTDVFYGELEPNWFRDTNEMVLLYGALMQVFIFLNEPDTSQMYAQLFSSEVKQVNAEENFRNASGGNIQININGGGLI